ncbi:hypothetical protein MNBD_GAMMA23-599 [hydrothermal vent metagenome]|uniref:Rhodanese domain-containing protein n=1 Tax=hydrothermal vent metagenome TaxID=652676 RepID=A0A3B1AE00_9ZZZZ
MKHFLRTLMLLLLTLSSLSYVSQVSASQATVSTDWLQKHLNNSSIILIDMSDETQYQRFHLKNAIQLPYHVLNQRLKNGVSVSIGRDNIVKLLGLLGVSASSHVIIYDDMGGLHAGRLFWELERINHQRISLLDGGLVKWILEGKPVTATPYQPQKKTNYPQPKLTADIHLASIEEVLPATRVKDTLLIDVRSQQEYVGNIKQRRSGHIPGARLWSWDNAVDFENQFKFKSKKILEDELKKIGLIKKEQPVILYCRSAHRATQSYLTLRYLGFKNVKVFDGSMKQYAQTADAPLTKGLKP